MVIVEDYKIKIDGFDKEAIYCQKLGHHLKFNYCRRESGELPCSRITKCWVEKLPIDKFLGIHFSAEELKEVFTPSSAKITTLIDLIQKAQALNE